MSIKIVTDSTSYIPKEYIEKYDIKVASLNVIMNGVSRREVEIDNRSFYEEMNGSSELPKSSQPMPQEMVDIFKGIVEKGDSVVGIFISSKMSGTYSTANMAKNMVLEEYPNAEIIILDSESNCMQLGFAVLEAARSAKEGKSIDEVIEKTKEVIKNSRFLFTPETLEYLQKGGRIGKAATLFGNMLKVKPILTIIDGETSIFKKVRTRRKAIDEIIEETLSDIESGGLGDVIVHHINCEEEGMKLAETLEEKLGKKVKIQSIGPVVGLHVGPGSMGIAYYKKS